VSVLWLGGYLLAMRHGVQLPPSAGPAALAHVPETIVRVFLATVGAEEAIPTAFLPIVVAGILLTTGALIVILRRRGRDPAAMMLAISLVATLPLAALWWDWNAWRAFFPVVGLGIGLTLALARHGALWGAGPVALQLVALTCAEPAGSPTILSPFTASEVSYRRLVRMQHVVDPTRRLVEREAGKLPPGAAIRFWDLPRGTLVGFEGELAPRVWLRDRTATFQGFDPPTDPRLLPHLVIAYNAGVARPPVVITRGALETIAHALAIVETDPARSDSLNAAAILAQSPPAAPLTIAATRARVVIALNEDRVADARRLADQAAAIEGPTPNTLAFDGAVAISEGRMAEAERLLRQALHLDPRNSIAAQGMANLKRRLGAGSR
jgi:hypothetical protein